jgi:natural product biosynthesis luciferase-like monooxygenase protein
MNVRKLPQFSLFFFNADAVERQDYRYKLLFEAAKFGDNNAFAAVWTPERHFQQFGGLYGSPSVTSAALATMTERISIRAGSVVLPLQNPLRVAEEWAMIDNISNGRVAIAFASGWHVNDFVLSPDTYENRRQDMYDKIALVQRLWRGEKLSLPNGTGLRTEVGVLPAPIQKELPIWLTGESDETFSNAGRLGFNVLTANFALGHNLSKFASKARIYRDAMLAHHGRPGHITMMCHTFVTETPGLIKSLAGPAMAEYIRVNIGMQREHAIGVGNRGGVQASGLLQRDVSEREQEILVRNQVAISLQSPLSLIGSLDHCAQQAEVLHDNGVDEIACLIDFGINFDEVMSSLGLLSKLTCL